MQTQETQKLEIRVSDLEALDALVAKLNRKAKRWGQPGRITYTVTGPPEDDEVSYWDDWCVLRPYAWVAVTVTPVAIDVPEIVLPGGWMLVAAIDHRDAGNIIRAAGGHELPERYRTSEPYCEHCNTRRDRRVTVVVKDEEGNYKQVGKSCLEAYLGLDPRALELMNFREHITDSMHGLREGGSGSVILVTAQGTLATTIMAVRQNKGIYISYRDAQAEWGEYKKTTTADTVRWTMYDKSQEAAEMRRAITEDDLAEAQKLIDWANDQPADSQYMHNLQTALALEYLKDEYVGIVVSAYHSHIRWLGKETARREAIKAEREAEKLYTDGYAAEIGDRTEWAVTVMDKRYGESDYGEWALLKFRSATGHCLIWWTSPENRVDEATEIGDELVIRGRVKDHSERNGIKQTVITRVTLVEKKEAEECKA